MCVPVGPGYNNGLGPWGLASFQPNEPGKGCLRWQLFAGFSESHSFLTFLTSPLLRPFYSYLYTSFCCVCVVRLL